MRTSMEQSKNIVVISSDLYPDGGASANRHLAWSRGLVEIGNAVTFILLAPQNISTNNFTIDGVRFISVHKRYLFSKLVQNHSSIVPLPSVPKGKRTLLQLDKGRKIDIVILLDTHVWMLKPFLDLCKRRHIKVFHERTEFPLITIKRGKFGSLHYDLYKRVILNHLDGIFVISQTLSKYFSEQVKDSVPIQVINMIVDPARFTVSSDNPYGDFRYIAYCGAMDIEKDGVDILIRAFGKAIQCINGYDDLKLLLIGSVSDRHILDKYHQVVKESECEGRVIFTGFVSRETMPGLLNHAEALVLARPKSKQAEGGFPTKLGEYLATAKPVVITKTGEISFFLQDGENAFIAEPGSVDSFAHKLLVLFNDYAEAANVGRRGQKLVYDDFNYLQQARRLNDFIRNL